MTSLLRLSQIALPADIHMDVNMVLMKLTVECKILVLWPSLNKNMEFRQRIPMAPISETNDFGIKTLTPRYYSVLDTRKGKWFFFVKSEPLTSSLSSGTLAQQVATVLAATATWTSAGIRGIGWAWAAVIWVYNIVIYLLLDPIKLGVRYALSGRAWNLVINKRVG